MRTLREPNFRDVGSNKSRSVIRRYSANAASRNSAFASFRDPVRRVAEKMLIAVLRHPSSAGQVAFPRAPRPLRLARCVDVQHNLRDLGPIGAVGLGIEETQISDKVFLVVILALRMCLMACGATARRDGGLLFSC